MKKMLFLACCLVGCLAFAGCTSTNTPPATTAPTTTMPATTTPTMVPTVTPTP